MMNEDARWEEAGKLAGRGYSYLVNQDKLPNGQKIIEIHGVELPVRAHGATFAEAHAEFLVALQTLIDHLLEVGVDVPPPDVGKERTVTGTEDQVQGKYSGEGKVLEKDQGRSYPISLIPA